ncbi:glycoside hydrolase family 105 protein [candidate division KSB1 bacterium]
MKTIGGFHRLFIFISAGLLFSGFLLNDGPTAAGRSHGLSDETVTRSTADQYRRYRFHIFEYPTAVAYYGLILLADATGDDSYIDYIEKSIDYYLNHRDDTPRRRRSGWEGSVENLDHPSEGEMEKLGICPWCSRYDPEPWRDGTFRPFFRWISREPEETVVKVWSQWGLIGGPTLAELVLRTNEEKYRRLVNIPADGWTPRPPRTDIVPNDRLLIDGAPGAGVWVRWGRITGESSWYDRAIQHLIGYFKHQEPATGLFYQGWGWGINRGTHTPAVWGRGSGWWAYGAAEALTHIPPDHPGWNDLRKRFVKYMEDLLPYQDSSGMWHQVVDRMDSWPETSGSSLIVFAMARGVRKGFLDQRFRLPARRGFEGLKGYVDTDGTVRNCCVGTGAQDTVFDYFARPMPPNDPHAPGPVIMAGAEIMMMEKEQ